jgi:hypothetical protein
MQRRKTRRRLIARILILLRQAMAYRAATEPDMSAERLAKLGSSTQRISSRVAIGKGLGKRSGGLTPEQVQQYYESRRYQKCVVADCYDYWLKGQLEWWGAAKFRERLLPCSCHASARRSSTPRRAECNVGAAGSGDTGTYANFDRGRKSSNGPHACRDL